MPVVITFLNGGQSGPTQGGAPLGGVSLTLDASLRQSHDQENEITEHPVEQGANVTDNIRPRPRKLVIEGLISATPPMPAGQAPEANLHIKAYKLLEQATAQGALVNVTTGLKKYTKLAIESLSCPREPERGIDLFFTLTLKEVIFATTATTTVPKSAIGTGTTKTKTQRQASARKHRGHRQTTPATAAQQSASQKAINHAANKVRSR